MIPAYLLVRMPGLEPVDVVLERYAAPTGIDRRGRPVLDAPTESTIRCLVHQSPRRQVERAGLDTSSDWHAFYCEAELRSGVEDGTRPDVLRIDGERWEVANVANYARIAGLWIALARRIT